MQGGTNTGRQMKGYEGRQGGSRTQQQARMEITQGDKWSETNEGRSRQEQARMEITKGDKWRQEQQRAGQNGDHAGRQMKGDKAAPEWDAGRQMKGDKVAASPPFSDFGDRRHSRWEVRTPIVSSYLGNKKNMRKQLLT